MVLHNCNYQDTLHQRAFFSNGYLLNMSRIRIVFFVGILSFILYIANLVVYEALADIFAIATSWQLILLGSLLGVLSGSFIAATI